MKRRMATLTGLIFLIFLTGCPGPDPLTALLKKNGYAPVVTMSDGYRLGDIYSGSPPNLTDEVYIENYPEIYSRIAGVTRPANVCLPEVAGKETFELTADADIIGKVKGRLSASGAKRFSVTIEDPCTYSISMDTFRTKVYPDLVARNRDVNYVGMYVVTSLLKAKRIEYTLTNEKDVNITISPQDVKKIISAELGMALDVNEHCKLYSSAPSYIGWKLHRIGVNDKCGPLDTRELKDILSTESSRSTAAEKAKIENLRKAQAKLMESIQTKEARLKELNEKQAISVSVLAEETKMEELHNVKTSPSGRMATEIKTKEPQYGLLASAQQEKAKIGDLSKAQAELSVSLQLEKAELEKLNEAQAELSASVQAEEAKMEELNKAREGLADSIVLEEVPMKELRKAQVVPKR